MKGKNMKKTIALCTMILATACSNNYLSSYVAENQSTPTTTKERLRNCSMEEAAKMVESGKAFLQPTSVTSEQISQKCMKKLALHSAGIDTDATKEANNALKTLMGK